jgi:hypothetical protein
MNSGDMEEHTLMVSKSTIVHSTIQRKPLLDSKMQREDIALSPIQQSTMVSEEVFKSQNQRTFISETTSSLILLD